MQKLYFMSYYLPRNQLKDCIVLLFYWLIFGWSQSCWSAVSMLQCKILCYEFLYGLTLIDMLLYTTSQAILIFNWSHADLAVQINSADCDERLSLLRKFFFWLEVIYVNHPIYYLFASAYGLCCWRWKLVIHKFWFSFQDTNLMKQFYPISEKIVSFPVERCSNFPLKEKVRKDVGLPVSWCGLRGSKVRYYSTNPFHKWPPFFCKHKRTDYLISCIATDIVQGIIPSDECPDSRKYS